jgi:hydrophobe/amphiphile efflux-1 (HAE1) family protein
MNFSKIFIDRPIATSMLMVAIVLLGLISYPLLPVSGLPRVDYPTVEVSSSYPGASPDTIAALIAAPLERQFAQIPGLTQMTSTSTAGTVSVTLQFDLDRESNDVAQDVQTAISSAGGQLPRDLPSPPSYRKINPADSPIVILAVTSKSLPMTAVSDAADTVMAQQISQIAGVGRVFIGGEQKPAVRLEMNPEKMAAVGLTFEDVRTAVAATTVERPKGMLLDARRTYTIDANDQLLKAEAYNDIIVAYRNDAPVRVRDLGRAFDGAENTQAAGWYNDAPGVVLLVSRQPGADVVATSDAIRELLPSLEASLPKGIDVHVVSDRTATIRASIHEVQFTLIIAVLLVVSVIFVFLRHVWGTVIPTIAMPISVIGTFAIMYLLGYSIDNLSLMGLTIAIGFIVDDAIVVVENIERHIREDGLSPYDAAVKGSSEIGFTIMSISISLIAVFIPLFMMSGYVGRIFREFAITVSAAVVVSLLVSLTLIPLMSSRLLSHSAESHGAVYTALENFFARLLSNYGKSLTWVLARQRLTLTVAAATLAATVGLFVVLPKGFFPEQDLGFLIGTMEAAPDIALVDLKAKQAIVMDILLKDPAVRGVSASTGGGMSGSNAVRMQISLKPLKERVGVQDFIARLRPQFARIPGVKVFMNPMQDIRLGGRLSKSLYQYTLSDTDQTELNTWAPKVVDKLRTLPMLVDVISDQDELMPQMTLNINRDSASRLGVTTAAIDDTLNDAFGQRQIATIFSSINQYHVILTAESTQGLGPSAFDRIYVRSTTGTLVPLSAVATLERTTAPPSVNHQGSFPAVTISFNLIKGASLGEAVQAIEQAMRDIGAPETIRAGFQGTAQAFQSSLSSTPWLIAAALLTIYIVLAMLYESLIHPLTILSTLPSAGVGALLTLLIFGHDFTVMALIGIILLMGIVKKNGIMMVDFALEGERKRGLSPEEAIYEACLKRFRPIMMTTMAAMFTGLPLAISTGDGAELRTPLGLTIVGGLIFSQALTLYTTPVIYLALERLRLRTTAAFNARFRKGKAPPQPAHHPSDDAVWQNPPGTPSNAGAWHKAEVK